MPTSPHPAISADDRARQTKPGRAVVPVSSALNERGQRDAPTGGGRAREWAAEVHRASIARAWGAIADAVLTARMRQALEGTTARWAAPRSPLKIGALILALLAFVWLVRPLPWSAPSLPHTPLWQQQTYIPMGLNYQAALDVSHGRSPYGAAIAWLVTHAPTDWRNLYGEGYAYPPFLAVLLIPLTALPLAAVALLWTLLSLACSTYLAAFLARIVLPQARGLDRALAVAVALDAALLFGPLRHSMRGEQVDIELIALAVGAYSALRCGRRITSGLLLGLAIAVKPTYFVLLGFYVWRREWRAASAMALAGAIGLAAPFLFLPHQTLADYQRITAYWNEPGFLMAPKSISIFGVVERAFYVVPGLWRIFTAPFVARAIEAAAGLGVYLAASRLVPADKGRSAPESDYTFGLALLVMLLGSPLTEDAHLALALIPLAVLGAPLLARGRRGEAGAWVQMALGGLFFFYVTLPVRGVASFSTYDGWRALLAGYWFYGLVGLATLYVWVGRQAPYRLNGPSVVAAAWGRTRRVAVEFGTHSQAR